MTVHLYDYELSYFSVPKCASTSLKAFFFEIENGFPFTPFHANGELRHIHNAAYPFLSFAATPWERIEGHQRLAILRDPVARVLSCYANRVVQHGDLDRLALNEAQRDKGVVERPDLRTFVRFLPAYRRLSGNIAHHTELLSQFLGPDPSYFSRLFRISELQDFVETVSDIVGDVPRIGHRKGSKSGDLADQLSSAGRNRISELFAEDYDVFGSHW